MPLPALEHIMYGPVRSRRLGTSLGINLLPAGKKICNMTISRPGTSASIPHPSAFVNATSPRGLAVSSGFAPSASHGRPGQKRHG